MTRLQRSALALFVGFACLSVAVAAGSESESDYAGLLRLIRASRKARHARRAGPSIVADPGVKLVVSQFVVCPALTGFVPSECALRPSDDDPDWRRPRRIRPLDPGWRDLCVNTVALLS